MVRFICGQPLSKSSSHPTESWWSSQVVCSKAEVVTLEGKPTDTEQYYTFELEGSNPLVVKNTLHELSGPPEHLLGRNIHRNITAFIEVRQPYWGCQPDWWITYHSLILLEVDDGALYILCERKTDALEMVIGELGIPLDCMKALRVYGPGRDLQRCIEQKREPLSVIITIHDFFIWLDGPLEEQWGPYDLLTANCQHFTGDVKGFLRDPLVTLNRSFPLERASHDQQMDQRFVSAEVARDWRALKFAREDFRRDRAVVLQAVARDGRALRYAHPKLRTDRELVLKAVANNGSVLPYVEGFLRQDREVVKAAVQQKGLMICYAALEHRQDRAVALAAVRQDGSALRYIAGPAQWDPEILLTAWLHNPFSTERAAF